MPDFDISQVACPDCGGDLEIDESGHVACLDCDFEDDIGDDD